MGPTVELVHGLRDQIANQLRKDIFAGRLAPGDRLYETELVKQFKVSRTPIREALHQLVQEGVLESKPNCGVRVAPETSYEIKALTGSIRRMIEVFALKSCFDDLDEEAFKKWDKIVGQMDKACRKKDYPTIYELDLEFHHEIIRRAGIPDLESIWKAILGRVRMNLRDTQIAFPDPMDADIVAKHANLLEALRSGDRKTAVDALSSHDY